MSGNSASWNACPAHMQERISHGVSVHAREFRVPEFLLSSGWQGASLAANAVTYGPIDFGAIRADLPGGIDARLATKGCRFAE